jgi:NADP-dependent 3-hydroxy acid dehydrogenase YdfG
MPIKLGGVDFELLLFMSLSGKAAIITGASGGIGGAIALALAGAGVAVTVSGRRSEALNDLSDRIQASGHQSQVVTCDLRSEEDICALFRKTHDRWGHLDILVNCAACGMDAPLSSGTSSDPWREMVIVNILAIALTSREAIRYFNPDNGGHIINIGSTSAYRVRAGSGFYAATKFAVRAMTEALRMELAQAKSSTKVTLISPGSVATTFFQDADARGNEQMDPSLQPEDVASVTVSALSSPANALVNEIVLRHCHQVP